ncbi:hypothetical protein BJ741DRAFT_599315 [Chytriomyces cf. hyalinus JEL632]|nr:hypothetical protein BJ741DRAFT_599315 [Chytriomyces cf. hyalinus JEL632]
MKISSLSALFALTLATATQALPLFNNVAARRDSDAYVRKRDELAARHVENPRLQNHPPPPSRDESDAPPTTDEGTETQEGISARDGGKLEPVAKLINYRVVRDNPTREQEAQKENDYLITPDMVMRGQHVRRRDVSFAKAVQMRRRGQAKLINYSETGKRNKEERALGEDAPAA